MTTHVRVHYPTAGRTLVLRTDADWGADVLPHAVSEDGHHLRFDLATDRAFLVFKACLRDTRGAVRWSTGANYVASASPSSVERLEVYPHFEDGVRGRMTECLEIPATTRAVAHRVRAYLPPGYDENPLARYPVLYMHDGTNLFFPEESFRGEAWHVQATVDLLDGINAIEPVLVVGIDPVDREREYTSPGYEDYARYLADTLKPAVDARLRTLPGPEHTVVMGSSLGGPVSLYLAWSRPEVFGGAASLSGSFGVGDDLFEIVARGRRPPIRVYLDSGWPGDNYDLTMAMRDALLRRGYRWGADLLHFAFPGDTHGEGSWAVRLHLPLQFFFHRRPRFA